MSELGELHGLIQEQRSWSAGQTWRLPKKALNWHTFAILYKIKNTTIVPISLIISSILIYLISFYNIWFSGICAAYLGAWQKRPLQYQEVQENLDAARTANFNSDQSLRALSFMSHSTTPRWYWTLFNDAECFRLSGCARSHGWRHEHCLTTVCCLCVFHSSCFVRLMFGISSLSFRLVFVILTGFAARGMFSAEAKLSI